MLKPKVGELIRVQYWDHHADLDDNDDGVLCGCVGYFCGAIKHKRVLMKISMSEDLSFPFTYVIVADVECVARLVEAQ